MLLVMAHSKLKPANIMAMFKKDKPMDKDILFNCWFILFKERPTFLNKWATFVVKDFWNGWYIIYVMNVYGQVSKKVLCGYRKSHSRQHTLFQMLHLLQSELKNFRNFTGWHFCWIFFLIKLQPFRWLKRDFNTGGFLWNLGNSLEDLLYRSLKVAAFRK